MPWLPQVLLGSLSVVAGLVAIILPETRWRPLPETIEQVEIWHKNPEQAERQQREPSKAFPGKRYED